jgi:hypothetical protein
VLSAQGWEAPQVAVLIAAFLGAAGATVAGLLVAGRQARTQTQLAERATKVAAYEEALRLCEHLRDYADRNYQWYVEAGEVGPEMAPIGDQIRARTVINLHGSPEVRSAYAHLESVFNAFWLKAGELRRDKERQSKPDLWGEVDECRKAVRAALRPLEAAMRADILLLPPKSGA